MIKLILILLFAFSKSIFAQVAIDSNLMIYSTPNLVNNSTSNNNTTMIWRNVGLWNQGLPCWAPGGPIYCGPLPYFNNGSFNFSYGLADVNQRVNINNAIDSSNTGLRVIGFNFQFDAKNGNGWDDGRVDLLSAYVRFFNKGNTIVENYNYNLTYKFDWTTFRITETFTNSYQLKDLNYLRYGFIGMDNNYWAGPYGPELGNIRFSLNYSIDTCVTNPLSSPSCPKFQETLAKLFPVTSIDTSIITSPVTSAGAISVVNNPNVLINPIDKNINNTLGTGLTVSRQNTNTIDPLNVTNNLSTNTVNISTKEISISQYNAVNIGFKLNVVDPRIIEIPVVDNNYNNPLNFISNRTNPITEIIENRQNLSSINSNESSINSVVNRNAENNEIAMGVSIERMAVVPIGYNEYSNVVLKDSAFYPPKAIYDNQKNVDNTRVLRQLSNDSKHREMVEGQYRR